MTLAVCCMSHTPLLELTDPGPDKTADVETAFAATRDFVRDDDPRTGDRVRPGPLQRLLP
jgi:2,3-dihydroxyphenylpropionate 1,2-dioxygenase